MRHIYNSSQRMSGCGNHFIRQQLGLCCHDTQTQAGINEGVISLSDIIHNPLIHNRFGRNTRSNKAATFCPLNEICRLGFCQLCRVAQREDERTFRRFGHMANNTFRKGSGNCRRTHKNRRTHRLNGSFQIRQFMGIRKLIALTSKLSLFRRKIRRIVKKKALLIDKIKTFFCLFRGKTLFYHFRIDAVSNTATGRTGTEAHVHLVR